MIHIGDVTTEHPNNMYVDLDPYWMTNKSHPFGPDAEKSKQKDGYYTILYDFRNQDSGELHNRLKKNEQVQNK